MDFMEYHVGYILDLSCRVNHWNDHERIGEIIPQWRSFFIIIIIIIIVIIITTIIIIIIIPTTIYLVSYKQPFLLGASDVS